MTSNVVVPASLLGGIGVGRGADFRKVRLTSWNIGSLTGKSIELVKSLYRCRISIACVQEIKWVGSKARIVDGYKLWYSGSNRAKNGVGILIDRSWLTSLLK